MSEYMSAEECINTTFRSMRRKRQQLDENQALPLLADGKTGILAVQGDDGYPYAVPVNYVFLDGKIYIHSATSGHKIDAIKRDDKVSFCVIASDTVIPESYTTAFRSVIAFGRARIIEDASEQIEILQALGRKYNPEGTEEALSAEISKGLNHLVIIEIAIDHLTGKEGIELVRKKTHASA